MIQELLNILINLGLFKLTPKVVAILTAIGITIAPVGGLNLGGRVGGTTEPEPFTLTEKTDRYESKMVSTLPEAGESKIEIMKDEPKVILNKWNGEVAMGVRYKGITATAEKETTLGGEGASELVKYDGVKQELQVYPLKASEGMEDGGLEIELILNEKPITNKFEFEIDGAENLDFFYQPELTQQEKDEGASRPENVIGSYAVYHKTRKNHRIGSTNYATGKAYHIYRPKVIDANNKEVWGELSFDGILTITVPQKFLDEATYPVKIDPTVGHTIIGSSAQTTCLTASDMSNIRGNMIDFGDHATLDSISVAVVSVGTESSDTYLAIYREDSAGSGSHDLVVGLETLNMSYTSTPTWNLMNASSQELVEDMYIFSHLCNGEDVVTNDGSIRYDSLSPMRWYSENSSGAGGYATRKAENPWTATASYSNLYTFSIYITYTDICDVTTEICTDLFTKLSRTNKSGYGSWTAPTGITSAKVACWGGGGGGGVVANSGGGGGGGGAFASSSVAVVPGTQYTIYIATSTLAEIAGEDSTFATTTVVADGGVAGSDATHGDGGTTANSTGDVEYAGGDGGDGTDTGDTSGGGGGAAGPHGAGGNGVAGNESVGGAGGQGDNAHGGTGGAGGNGGNGVVGGFSALGGGGSGGGDDGYSAFRGGLYGAGGGGGEIVAGRSGSGRCEVTYGPVPAAGIHKKPPQILIFE